MSVCLSDVVNVTVHESRCPPSEDNLNGVSYIVSKVQGASRALRIQLANKMKLYLNKLISEEEVLNCLYLTQYVVMKQPSFRPQVADIDFIALMEVLGKKKNGKVQSKVHEILEEWAAEYPNELSEYNVLYLKYVNEGIIKLSSKPKKLFDLPKEIVSLAPPMEHCLREIQEALEDNGKHNFQKLYESSTKLNSKMIGLIAKYRSNGQYDQNQLGDVEEFSKKFGDSVQLLADKINQEIALQSIIHSSFVTTHSILDTENRGLAIRSKKTSKDSSSSLHSKFSLQLQPPPSKGMPLKPRHAMSPNPMHQSKHVSSYQHPSIIGRGSVFEYSDDHSLDLDSSTETPMENNPKSDKVVASSNVFEEMDFDEQTSLL